MTKYLFYLCISLVVLACSTTKKTSKTDIGSENKSATYKNLLSGTKKDYPTYTSMASDIRLDADIDGSSYRASGVVRHVRNEGVFVSVKKLGFEIGQVLLTPDSFFVLNRWEKEYIKEPISIIENEYQIKGEYAMVEELLTGIPQVDNFKKNSRSIIENGNHRLETPSVYSNIDLTLWIAGSGQEIIQAFYQDSYNRGVRMKYGSTRKNKLVIERELHTENIDDSDSDIHIKLAYKNPEFNKAKLPTFKIPSHYSRRRL